MKLAQSAFVHVPQLQDKIRDPEASQFRNIDLDEIDRRALASGYESGWRRPDAEREASRRACLAGRDNQDVWVFAYGSLMWDPGFYFDEVRLGRAHGFHRSFCLHMKIGRGSPKGPGLMAALDSGKSCDGLVFRIVAKHADRETEVIWRREMIGYGYVPTFIEVETAAGKVEAVTFVIDRKCDRYACGMDVDEAARMIAGAEGINGTNMEYLDNLAIQLDLLGLDDPEFNALHARARGFANGRSRHN